MSSRVPRPQRQLRAPTATVRPRSVLSADHHARLAHRLTPRDRWLIRMLHEHHVLTTDTVTTMAFPSARSARQRLLELYQWDVIDRFQPLTRRGSAAMHYVLGGAGAAVLAAEQGLTTKALGYRHDHVLAVAHRHTLAHTVAINDFFARLVRRTITHHDVRLVAWWSETRCARYVGDLARPDAYGRITLPPPDTAGPAAGHAYGASHGSDAGHGYTVDADTAFGDGSAGSFAWFFELDFGTEPLPRVAGKLEGYTQLAAATAATTPVLIWLPSLRREAGAREELARALRRLERPDLIRIATTSPLTHPNAPDAEPDLTSSRGRGITGITADADPADRVWLPLADRTSPASTARPTPPVAGQRGRIGLAELAAIWPARTDHSYERLIAPGTGRAGAVELPAPHPISPDTATFNPATSKPATRNTALCNPAAGYHLGRGGAGPGGAGPGGAGLGGAGLGGAGLGGAGLGGAGLGGAGLGGAGLGGAGLGGRTVQRRDDAGRRR